MPTILDTPCTPVLIEDSGVLTAHAHAVGADVQADAPRFGWNLASGLDFTRAQETLDWLENQSIREREMVLGADGKVTIRWKA